MINKGNYEAFALDYIENNLSASERAAMQRLMAENPEIRAEIALLSDAWGELTLSPNENIVFSAPEKLLKPTEKPTIIVPLYRQRNILRAAALVGMLIGTGALLWYSPTLNHQTALAQKTEQATGQNLGKIEKLPLKNIENIENKDLAFKNNTKTAENTTFNRDNMEKNTAKKSLKNTATTATTHLAKAGKSIENKAQKPQILEETPLLNDAKMSVSIAENVAKAIGKIENNSQNAEILAYTPRRTAYTLAALPVEKIQDFYLETNKTYFLKNVMAQENQPELMANTPAKGKKALNLLLPEGTAPAAREGSLWKAFLPENATLPKTDWLAIAEAFRPSR